MCGRYVAAKDPAALVAEFDIDEPSAVQLQPDYNVAPTKQVYIIAERLVEEEGETQAGTPAGIRMLRVARWGLVPGWAKDPSIGSKMINARAETAAEKPSFRAAVARRRCLIPADGYYEWQPSAQGRKQPFYIHPRNDQSLAMAGLYEWWRDPTQKEDGDDAWLLTCSVLTTAAQGQLAGIHDRMPGTIARADWDAWLDPGTRVELQPFLARGWQQEHIQVDPVSTSVNNVRMNGPALIEPLSSLGG